MTFNKPQVTQKSVFGSQQISIDHNRHDPIDRFNWFWLNVLTLPTRPVDLAYDALLQVTGIGLAISLTIALRPVLTTVAYVLTWFLIFGLLLTIGVAGFVWQNLPVVRYCIVYRLTLIVFGVLIAL